MNSGANLVKLRAYEEQDKAFIISTWLKGLKYGNSWYKLIDDKIYFRVYHDVVERLMCKPDVAIIVACLDESPDVILGFSVLEGEKLHWVHVKRHWRGIGIAKSLVPSHISTVTHLTTVGVSIFLKKEWVFNPFLLL